MSTGDPALYVDDVETAHRDLLHRLVELPLKVLVERLLQEIRVGLRRSLGSTDDGAHAGGGSRQDHERCEHDGRHGLAHGTRLYFRAVTIAGTTSKRSPTMP